MIYAFIGKQRSGKTVRMTQYVLDALNHGRVVYANYGIKWNPNEPMSFMRRVLHRTGIWKKTRYPASNLRVFKNWNDVLNVAGAVVALDEGWQYFDSYSKLPIDKRMRLYQSGKWEIDYLYTVQRYKMADINLRWSTDEFWESTLYKIPFRRYPLIIYRLYDLDEDDDGATIARKGIEADGKVVDLAIKKRWWFTRKKDFDVYDTKEDIYATEELRDVLQKKVDARTADTRGFVDPTPTYWSVVWGLITGKYVTHQSGQLSGQNGRGVASEGAESVVARVPARVNADHGRVVGVDGVIRINRG